MKILRESRGRKLAQRRRLHWLGLYQTLPRERPYSTIASHCAFIINQHPMSSSNGTNGKRPRSLFYVRLTHFLDGDRSMEGQRFVDFQLCSLL